MSDDKRHLKKSPGRPSEGRPNRFSVRLSDEALEALTGYCEERGVSRGKAINEIVLAHALNVQLGTRDKITKMNRLSGDIKRLGVLLNQIAKTAHVGGLERVANSAEESITEIRHKLLPELRRWIKGESGMWLQVAYRLWKRRRLKDGDASTLGEDDYG